MNSNPSNNRLWVFGPLLLGLIVPSLIIFCLEVFVGHIRPLVSLTGIARRQFSEGDNLFLLALFGLIPFVVLSMICTRLSRSMPRPRLACLCIGGLIGILALMIPGHISVWYSLYVHRHASSTSVIAFFFIPFYCIVTLAIGLFVGWGVSLFPIFRRENRSA